MVGVDHSPSPRPPCICAYFHFWLLPPFGHGPLGALIFCVDVFKYFQSLAALKLDGQAEALQTSHLTNCLLPIVVVV